MLSIKKLFTKVLGNLKSLNGVEIPSNADLNDYNDVGQYYASSNAIASSLSNKPSALAVSFTLIVLNKGGYNNQVIYANDGSIWFRTQYSGGWQNWMTYAPRKSVNIQSWSGIVPTQQNKYYTLKTLTIPANSRYLIVAQNGNANSNASLNMCGFVNVTGSGTLALQWAAGLNNSGAGNRAIGWCYVETGNASHQIGIQTYSYSLSNITWNGVAVAIPV